MLSSTWLMVIELVLILICDIQYFTHPNFLSVSPWDWVSTVPEVCWADSEMGLDHQQREQFIWIIQKVGASPFSDYSLSAKAIHLIYIDQIYDCHLIIYFVRFRNMNILKRQVRLVTLVAVRNTLSSVCTIQHVWNCWLYMFCIICCTRGFSVSYQFMYMVSPNLLDMMVYRFVFLFIVCLRFIVTNRLSNPL